MKRSEEVTQVKPVTSQILKGYYGAYTVFNLREEALTEAKIKF